MVAFSVAISSAAPHVGGAEFEFPAWIMDFFPSAFPTSMSQLSWDSASMAGVQEPALTAMACPALSQSE